MLSLKVSVSWLASVRHFLRHSGGMTEKRHSQMSMWEHAGFPGIPNGHKTPDTDEVDEVFKGHFRQLLDQAAPAVERAESALAWSVLREDDFRRDLAFNYDWEVLNTAWRREPGIAEELDYQQQIDDLNREVAEDAEAMRAAGEDESYIQSFIRHATARRFNRRVEMKYPTLPSVDREGDDDGTLVKAASIGAAWTLITGVLAVIAHLLGFSGPVTNLLAHSPWLYVPAALLAVPVAALPFYICLDSRPESHNRWLMRDYRSFWPAFTWCAAVATSVVVLPFWATAALVPVSAVALLSVPAVRKRLLLALGGKDAAMLESQELIGRPARYGANLFVAANETAKARGAALPPSLPHMSRDGSSTDSTYSMQERVAELAVHCSVEPSGMAEDIHRVTAAILLDVVMGITGADDLRLIAQYGSGPRRITAQAVAIGMGQEPLTSSALQTLPRPGRAVAPWWEQEAEAYRAFVRNHLSEGDAAIAINAAVDVLLQAREYDFPHESLYRLETITYGLLSAS